MTFKWPNTRHRVAIVGRTGSGKTQLGAHVLSKSAFDKQPYVIFDYKGDELLNSIERAREIGLNELPKHPGLYILHLNPGQEDETESWLWRAWRKEDIGLYIDEAYMLGDTSAFRSILTQGRSKRIPAICLSQRPVDVPRFVFSEAQHVAFFHLNDERDEDTIKKFTPKGFIDHVPTEFRKQGVQDETNMLPKYHSRWYNIDENEKYILKPVPKAEQIIAAIDSRLQPKRKWL